MKGVISLMLYCVIFYSFTFQILTNKTILYFFANQPNKKIDTAMEESKLKSKCYFCKNEFSHKKVIFGFDPAQTQICHAKNDTNVQAPECHYDQRWDCSF